MIIFTNVINSLSVIKSAGDTDTHSLGYKKRALTHSLTHSLTVVHSSPVSLFSSLHLQSNNAPLMIFHFMVQALLAFKAASRNLEPFLYQSAILVSKNLEVFRACSEQHHGNGLTMSPSSSFLIY